jgi:hypothetical protein
VANEKPKPGDWVWVRIIEQNLYEYGRFLGERGGYWRVNCVGTRYDFAQDEVELARAPAPFTDWENGSSDDAEELERLRSKIKTVVPYVTATITPTSISQDEWISVHRGRAVSSVRQLEQLEDMATL